MANLTHGDAGLRRPGSPETGGEAELQRLRDVGFTDEDILHLVEITAIFNNNVRLATATGLFSNPEYHELGRVSALARS